METIEFAKKNLEEKIILEPHVLGIGVILNEGEKFIEVSVTDANGLATVAKMIPNSKWEGFPVKIVIRSQTII